MYIKINRQKKHFDRIGGKSTSKEKKNTKPKKSNNMKKTSKIIFRISAAEKQAIQEFCKVNNCSLSELIRMYFIKLISHE